MEQFDLLQGFEKQEEAPPLHSDAPLAARIRPRSLEEYIGQNHLLDEGKLLRRAVEADRFTSILFYGPPGVGKTSLAELIALKTKSAFIRLSGVISTVADIRKEISMAVMRKAARGLNTILFVDEIHRLNKAQQDVLLPDVESGTVRLIGATTYNPQFYVIGALLSRSLLFPLEPLNEEHIKQILERAIAHPQGFAGRKIMLHDAACDFLCRVCEGDARKTLTAFEIAVLTTPENEDGVIELTLDVVESSVQQKAVVYEDDGHYDTASAFIKSMRGSDPDAAVYWLAKMLHAGEDIRFIARRLVIFASEDIGNADPRAITLTASAMDAVERIGMPEARIILSQAVTYCATAPKSNASYMAIDSALNDIRSERVIPIPKHLRDAHYKGAKSLGHGIGYQYPHDFENNFVPQDYLGVEKSYYSPVNSGYEAKIAERMKYWEQVRTLYAEAESDEETRG